MSAHSGRVSRPRCMPRRSPRAIFLCRVSPSSSRTNRVSPPRRYVKYRAPSSREKNIWRPVCRAASCSSVSGMPSPVGQGRGKSIRRRWRSSTIRSGPKARQQADNRFSILNRHFDCRERFACFLLGVSSAAALNRPDESSHSSPRSCIHCLFSILSKQSE